ncbi:MAG: SWIM zinc finger family protein [Actinomycetota bacterium]|nr:SWIM zinc finger family protein [Actinomycetota bacterium]
MDTISVEQIAERIEQELVRVRAKRPELASRISRAENIIMTHLSCRRARVIRVRVRDERPRFLVNGSEGAVYVVDPSDWSCTCPDHHRHGKGCKHSLCPTPEHLDSVRHDPICHLRRIFLLGASVNRIEAS